MSGEDKVRKFVDSAIYDYIVVMQGLEFANEYDYSEFNDLLDGLKRKEVE